MCNNTSLSHFLEGVNFMDEELNAMSDFQLEDEFFGEDGNLLMLDMDINMDESVLDTAMEFPSEEALPPMDMAHDPQLDALLSPPVEAAPTPVAPMSAPAPPSLVHQTSLEKLAHCMHRSEVTLLELQKQNLKPTHHVASSPVLMKANPFFTGSRVTITPELERSRQQLWSFVRQQQMSMGYTHKTAFTAAA